MTFTQRLLSVGAAGVLLFGGMAFGKFSDSPKSISADEVKTALTETTDSPKATSDNETFYLKDFQTGYDDGFASGRNGQTNGSVATEREGYNEGFKKGYADAYQKQGGQSVAYQNGQRRTYNPTTYQPRRKRDSKLKTVLTIAGPAAVGAGIGAAAGGKKGAAAGALIGGGGGAIYHVYKNRNR